MAHIIGSPSRYVQGSGELKNLAKNVAQLGSKLFILTSASGRGRVEGKIAEGLGESTAVYEVFNGECCMTEIDRVKAAFDASGCDLIVGIGGGKIHDTAKAAAYYAGVPVVIVPTIASTDAPCPALSVIYTEDGVFEKYLFLPANPNLVLMDTDIIAGIESGIDTVLVLSGVTTIESMNDFPYRPKYVLNGVGTNDGAKANLVCTSNGLFNLLHSNRLFCMI